MRKQRNKSYINLGKGDSVRGNKRCKDLEGEECFLFLRNLLEAFISETGRVKNVGDEISEEVRAIT